MAAANAGDDGGIFALPAHWDAAIESTGEDFVEVSPANHKDEYDMVMKMYKDSADADERFNIIQILRVQNLEQHVQYEAQQTKVTKQVLALGEGQPVERYLWHGTTNGNSLKICMQEFNRSFANRMHGSDFGEGSYFHTSATVAISLSDMIPDATILLAKVITGRYRKGDPSFSRKCLSEEYHSTVDDVENPTVFVVYHDAAAYPAYVVRASYRSSQ